MLGQEYKHWQLKIDENNIAWVSFDKAESEINTIDSQVLLELNSALDIINENKSVVGLIVTSAKANGFIYGADISQFKTIDDMSSARELITQGHSVFNKLSECKLPTLALIDGLCLGGGLELALACNFRVACDDDKTKLALPEVKLGIQPGWGGSVRLPRLIGVSKAFDMMLTGRMISAKRAKKIGLVNVVPPKRLLLKTAVSIILSNQKQTLVSTHGSGENKNKENKENKDLDLSASVSESFVKANQYAYKEFKGFEVKFEQKLKQIKDFFNDTWLVRRVVSGVIEAKLNRKVNPEHYPAPYAMLANYTKHGLLSDEGFDAEIDSICSLIETTGAQNLVKVFFLQEQLKKNAKNAIQAQNDKSEVEFESQIKHVHVVGAGIMGGDIAAWCAYKGLKVTIQDLSPQNIAPAIGRAYKLAKAKLKSDYKATNMMDRITADPDGISIANADVIIEAVAEDVNVKREVFHLLETKAKPDAIIATNTSTISIEEMAIALRNPERLVGIHFFNPVAKMSLVEVIVSEHVSESAIERATAFCGLIDKLPVVVRSCPGFLVNRILLPYMLEAVCLYEEGVTPETIDKAARDFGMAMGPIELADAVGLDICLSALEKMAQDKDIIIPSTLKKKVASKTLGKKTGCGFYKYSHGKAVTSNRNIVKFIPEDVTSRLILTMVNEVASILREDIVKNTSDIDAASIFGFGFAPFRAGVYNYMQTEGFLEVGAKLEELEKKYGSKFKKDIFFESYAK